MKRLGWHSMSLSRRVLLLLTLVLVSAAVQISIAQIQNLHVFRPMEENAEQIQTISQFLHETEKCIGTLEEYHWEYGDPDALNEEVRSSMKAASDHLSSLKFRDGAVSENTLLLFHAVRTTYPFYVERLDEIRQALENNDKSAASRIYYDTASPCGQYLAQYSRELLEQTILDSHDEVFSLTSTSKKYNALHLASSLAALLATVVLALWLRSLLVSISQLSKASRNISEGNFDIPDVDDRRQDEMGRLASTFNEMKQSMKGQMDLLREKGEMERKLRIKETEALELQNRVDAGKLQLLRSQIHPHFLFNTLNVISYRAKRENAPETVELLGSLSRFFRYTLGSNDAYVPLSKDHPGFLCDLPCPVRGPDPDGLAYRSGNRADRNHDSLFPDPAPGGKRVLPWRGAEGRGRHRFGGYPESRRGTPGFCIGRRCRDFAGGDPAAGGAPAAAVAAG